MQTYPCGHRVVCRKCFVKTIQVAVTQRCLPLRCVVCRTRVLKLKQAPPMPRSKSPGATAKALFGVGKSSSSNSTKGSLTKGTLGGKLGGRSTLVPVSRHPAALIPSPTGKPPQPLVPTSRVPTQQPRDTTISQRHPVVTKDSKHAPLVLCTQRATKLTVPHAYTSSGTKVRRHAHVTRQ